ncbi:hypothetical protein Q0A17_19200 [Citrobacter sp. S2-9]|uniref:Uncharacterized protein n=1 Tax=Citrobacter enshiensis TaxID=2971264 RepID=A0ABT8PYP5_9ENTR|nr:hypothetical protein [Citrobacter enshiensis]MDN8601515.1 hypothetical protein [Citrobacter enshiensis]
MEEKDSDKNFFEHTWIPIAGLSLGALTLIFLMVVVIMSMLGHPLPDNLKYIVISIMAFGLAFSTAFLGGRAVINGAIPGVPGQKAMNFSMTGGVAVFLIVFIVASYYIPSNIPSNKPDELTTKWNRSFVDLKNGVAKIFDVDDVMRVKINGETLPDVKYGSSESFDIKDKLKVGENIIAVEIFNAGYGGCSGALQLIFNRYEDDEFKWVWKNNFAEANKICYSETRKFFVK